MRKGPHGGRAVVESATIYPYRHLEGGKFLLILWPGVAGAW